MNRPNVRVYVRTDEEDKVIKAFIRNKALCAEKALDPDTLKNRQWFQNAVQSLTENGALTSTAEGRYYINPDYYKQLKRSKIIGWSIAAVLLVIALVVRFVN